MTVPTPPSEPALDKAVSASYLLGHDVMAVIVDYLPHFLEHPKDNVAVRITGYECSLVSKGWRDAVRVVLGVRLPPSTPASVAVLVTPGRLAEILNTCRLNPETGAIGYDSSDYMVCYDRLVHQVERIVATLRLIFTGPTTSLHQKLADHAMGQIQEQEGKYGQSRRFPAQILEGTELSIETEVWVGANAVVCRFGLMLYVGLILTNPAFSWSSTLDTSSMDIIESCVGSIALLNAMWSFG
ncbi:unnamed protein product [Choristocarpus tenellus]